MGPEIMTQTEAFIALNMLPRVGPVRVRKLLEVFGSPDESSRQDQPNYATFRESEARSPSRSRRGIPCRARGRGRARGHLWSTVITQADSAYPALLREIHDPPIVLYVWGNLSDPHAIGIVGTRNPSHYAAECAKKLAYQLAYAGLTVVSGLARGIDTAAHQAALAARAELSPCSAADSTLFILLRIAN